MPTGQRRSACGRTGRLPGVAGCRCAAVGRRARSPVRHVVDRSGVPGDRRRVGARRASPRSSGPLVARP